MSSTTDLRYSEKESFAPLTMRARELYEELRPERDRRLVIARECSKLTIQNLFPAIYGPTRNFVLDEAYQSTGTRGVEFLAATLLLTLFPPNIQVLRIEADPVFMREMAGTRAKVEIDSLLSVYATKVADEVDAIELRGPMAAALRHLLVAGDTVFYLPVRGKPRNIVLDQFVQEKDGFGNLLTLVVCESLSQRMIPERARRALAEKKPYAGTSLYVVSDGSTYGPSKSSDKSYGLYTVIRARERENEWDPIEYDVHQEIEDVVIEGSFGGPYDEHTLPFMSWGHEWMGGESYSRSYVELHRGSLSSLEGLTQAIVEGAAMMAKMLVMVDPTGLTDPDDLVDSDTGDVIRGRVTDVNFLQAAKSMDLGFAASVLARMDDSLSRDFGLTFVPREGERVTAEEIRVIAEQLERGRGGIYSHYSNRVQRPTFERIMHRLEKKNEAPVVPLRDGQKQVLKTRIVTGLEALGRGNDSARLEHFLNQLVLLSQAGAAVPVIDMPTIVKKLALADGIDPEEILKSEEQLAAEQQAARVEQDVANLGPEVIRQAGRSSTASMMQTNGSPNGSAAPMR